MKKAFTLSEILITLVVIGVLSVISILVFQAEYKEYEKIARVKKTYSVLISAMTLAKAEGGDMIIDFTDDNMTELSNWYNTYLKHRLSTLKVCFNTKGCWDASDVTYFNKTTPAMGVSSRGIGNCIISLVLNDGTLVTIDPYASNHIKSKLKVNAQGTAGYVFYFDINGERKPNVFGKDIFAAVFTTTGMYPAYANASKEQIEKDCSSSGTGLSCIIKYLKS